MPVRQTTTRWRVTDSGGRVRDPLAGLKEEAASNDTQATPRTHADADARAAELGLEFPEEVKTVAQKVEYLDQQG